MGPYYRHTSQGMGSFLELFYEHPALMLIFAVTVVGAVIFMWRRKKQEE